MFLRPSPYQAPPVAPVHRAALPHRRKHSKPDVFYEHTLTWDKQFNETTGLTFWWALPGNKPKAETFSASGQGFPDDNFLNGLSSAALALPPKASESQSSLLSFYLRGNYALMERYLFTVTARSDASSKFPKITG